MLYSQNVKNLVSGISQQAPILRLPEQLEDQLNGLSTESAGLQKRPPTVHVKTLLSALDEHTEPLIHFVDRDSDVKYIIYFFNNLLYVLDLAGNFYTVDYKADPAYLETSKPRESLRVITVGDHTFIVNREVYTRMRGEYSPNVFETQGALVHVKAGQYGRTYSIWADGNLVASFETPDGSDKSHTKQIDTAYIANQLATQGRSKGYSIDSGDCWLRINGAHSISTQDGYNNNAMVGFTNSVQRFNLLPSTAPEGYIVKIKGDPDGNNAGSYYVKYDSSEKVWEECLCPNMPIGYEAKTMPHELVRQANNVFVFKQIDWIDRKIGDEDSNPLPSFINHPINDIFFHRNRLGFLSGENVICSESAEYFNFWMTTANDVLDTDPIDVSTTTSRVNILNYAVSFSGELYCFSDKSQFVLRADTTLSPKNTALVEATGFSSSPDCRPVKAGRNLYFAAKRSEFTSIKEYYSVQQVSDEKNAQDITAHVPDFIPNGVFSIESSTNENIMFVLTTGDPNCIYVYKYLFINENRVQSSWSKWDMGGKVFNLSFVGSTLYCTINRGGVHTLEKINFTTSTTEDFVNVEPYRVHLDCKKIASTGIYNPTDKTTTFDLYSEYALKDTRGFSKVGLVSLDGAYIELAGNSIENGKFRVSGDFTQAPVILGVPYVFSIKFSPLYVRRQDSNGGVQAMLNGRLQVRNIHLNYADTGGFVVTVKSKNSAGMTCTYNMTAKVTGTDSARIGRQLSDTGVFKFPIQALNTNVDISLVSDRPLPISLIGFLWEGSWVQRSRGV